jgi:predicted TIM-barrel fold metal-dependent hydrolase
MAPEDDGFEEHYVAITTDSHVGPPTEVFEQYCPAKYKEDFASVLREVRANTGSDPDRVYEHVAKKALGIEYVDPGLLREANRANRVAGQWDPDARRADMDADGVCADVIFHGTFNGEQLPFVADALFPTVQYPAELEAVGCRMYNQWVADFISGATERHAALAYVPWSDIDLAVQELEWAREHGLRGVNFPAPNKKRPYYYDPMYEKFWAAAADLEMPLTTHSGGGDLFTYDDGVMAQAFQKMEMPFACRRAFWQLVFAGVFERHPKVKLVLTEIHAEWVNETLRDCDFAFIDGLNTALRERIGRLPSEQWMTNCYIGGSFMSHDEALMYPDRGCKNLMWASDYPHPEGAYPYTRLSMQTTFEGIEPENVRPIIGLTAAEVYGFDVSKLRPLADKIGPTVGELWNGPEGKPDDDYIGYAFRSHSSWPATAYYSGDYCAVKVAGSPSGIT